MKLQNFDIFIISVLIGASPFLLLLTNVSGLMVVSFFSYTILLALYLPVSIKSNNAISICICIFILLFFVAAPIAQLVNDDKILVNTMAYDDGIAIGTNLIIFLFLFSYILADIHFRGKFRRKAQFYFSPTPSGAFKPETVFRPQVVYFLVALLAAAVAFREILSFNVTLNDETNLSLELIKNKVFFMLPFVFLSLYLTSNDKKNYIIILVAIALVLVTKNHFFERRNAIGPIYLSIFVIFFPQFVQQGKKFFYLVASIMLVFFPLSSLLTHKNKDDELVINGTIVVETISNHFTQLHYDAWSNISAVIEIVTAKGLYYGSQLLGTLFFFVPRSLWQSKAEPTGFIVGDYLISNNTMWFNNLSAPLPAEGYIDFGIPGVAFFGIILAYLSNLLKAMTLKANNFLVFYIYISFSMFFILRGALMPSFAYAFGAFISIILIPYLFSGFSIFFRKVKSSVTEA